MVVIKFEMHRTEAGVKAFLDIFGRRLGIMFYKKPNIPTMGVGSRCQATSGLARFPHVSYIDYDMINEWLVKEELAWLVDEYGLSPYYLFYTRRNVDKQGTKYEYYWGNYQAISLTKLTFKEAIEILGKTHSDYNYKRMPHFSRYKMWILRFIAKQTVPPPKFLCMVPNNGRPSRRQVSKTHLDFLEKWHGVPRIKYPNVDKSDRLFVTPYVTGKG